MIETSYLFRHNHRQAIMLMVAVMCAWIFVSVYLFVQAPKPGESAVAPDVQVIQGISAALALYVFALTTTVAKGAATPLLINSIGHAMVVVAVFLSLMLNAGSGFFANPWNQGIAAVGAVFAALVTVGSATTYQKLRMHELATSLTAARGMTAMPGMKPAATAEAGASETASADVLPETAQTALAAGIQRAYRPTSQSLIEVENLVKFYGPTRAVNGISFTIDRGEIVGFLGPNGAGKTTTMKILTTYLTATAGRASVAGYDVTRQPLNVRDRLGYLPEANPLYREMRVSAYLDFIAQARCIIGAKRSRNLAWVREACGLQPVWQMRINELSKGFRQRVGLAQAIIHEPDILILDEPSSGLDPNQIVEIRELIRELGRHRTIILSTHILQEVTALCSRVMIINHGQLVANGSADELCRAISPLGHFRLRATGDAAKIESALGAISSIDAVSAAQRPSPPTTTAATTAREWTIGLAPSADNVDAIGAEIGRACRQVDAEVIELRNERPTLEDVFVSLTRASGSRNQGEER